jgi:predicted MFS family arabinose efflux permease
MLSFKIFLQHRKFFAPAFLYSCFSLIFSTWVTYIPYIADKLNITEGKIGGALFFMACGSLTMLPISNKLTDKLGVGRQAFFGFVGYALAMYGMFLAPNYGSLCIALFIFGNMSSIFAISLNSLTAIIERNAGMYIMTGSHGFWSLGGIVGASTGSFIAGLLHRPLLHITLLIVVLISLQLWLKKEYFHIRSDHQPREKHQKFPFKPLLAIASIAIIMMVSEGAIADWSALYLKNVVEIKRQFIGLGYALFSMGMAIGRFTGDSLSRRLGSYRLLRLAIGTSLIGFVGVLLSLPFTTMPGFFVIGLGFSIIVPEVYRLASNIKGIKTADGVSFISATANVGFLTGPVLLGFIAELHTLQTSFIVLTGFIAIAFTITFFRK